MAKQKEQPVETQNEVMAKPHNEVTPAMENPASWGTGNLTKQDIVIPRILLMQPMSEKVTAGEAAFGEFRESLNYDKLGGFDKPFTFVPFHMDKVFVEYDVSDPEDKKFLRVVPITPKNENLPYEDEEKDDTGKMIQVSRDRTMNFFVLLPQELKLGGAIPYILSFRRTSLQAGKKLATQMYVKNHAAGKIPPAVICEVSASKQTQDKKTWAVMEVKPVDVTPAEFIAEAYKWMQVVTSGQAKIDTESYNTEAKEASGKYTNAAPQVEADVEKGPAKF